MEGHKLRVLYIAVGNGGSDMSLLSLIDTLKKTDIEPFVVLAKSKSRSKVHLDKLGVKYVNVDIEFNVYPNRFTFKKRLLYFYYVWRKLHRKKRALVKLQHIYNSFSPDIIHTNVSVFDVGYLLAKRNKTPHVWHLREYVDLDFDFRWIPSKCHFQSFLNDDKFNFNLGITKQILDHHTSSKRSEVVYNGLVDSFSPSCLWPKENYFLFVGAIMKHKGIFELIESYALYRKLNPTSVIRLKILANIKRNFEEKEVRQLINSNQLSGWIDFLGFSNDVLPVMSKAKAVIVPSLNEAFGRIVTEAMEAGSIVIGRNTSGIKMQFDNGFELTNKEIGIRFNSNEEMVNAMIQVERFDQTEYSEIVKRAQLTVLKLYSKDACAKKVLSVYHRVLKPIS